MFLKKLLEKHQKRLDIRIREQVIHNLGQKRNSTENQFDLTEGIKDVDDMNLLLIILYRQKEIKDEKLFFFNNLNN